uniref:Uncharacterized protein n=1 Tax=Esox lucius TaxID=8010 RepID=A0A6Q2ZFT1_ESOLU
MSEDMSIFPRIALKPEVHDYLRNVFSNKEVLAAVGQGEAEKRFQRLLSCLSHPPAITCVRTSTHLAPLEEIQHRLEEELKQVGAVCFPSQQGHYRFLHRQVPEALTWLDWSEYSTLPGQNRAVHRSFTQAPAERKQWRLPVSMCSGGIVFSSP